MEDKKYIRLKSRTSLLVPLIIWTFVIIYLYGSRNVIWSDGFLTMRVCTILLLICTLAVLKREFVVMDREAYERWKAEQSEPVLTQATRRQILMFGILIVYMLLLQPLGFLIDTILFVLVVMWWLGVRDWKLLVLIPILTSVILFYIFKYLLFIRLPLGVLKGIL